MTIDAFVCPECDLATRPAAYFFSRGKSWWSVSRAEAARYRQQCRHCDAWPGDTILGCQSMRTAIDPWLRVVSAPVPPPAAGAPDEVSIVDVATSSVLVEARGPVAVAIPPEIGESFRDPDVRAAFQANPGSAEVRTYELRDVVFDAARLILLRDASRIAETRYLVDEDYYREPIDPRRSVRDIDTGRTVVIGVNPTCGNYYHWLMQSLPAIDHSVRAIGAENCVLALPPLAPFQEETLALLGHASIPRVELDISTVYRFRCVAYCTYLNGAADDHVSPFCLEVLDRLASRVEPIEESFERIYVSRLDSRQRVMRNESLVRGFLESIGFVTLVPGLLPLRVQIGLFRGARLVVGAHGGGMANLAFCQPGATALELIQSSYPVLYMNRIAQGRGLRYHAECFECESGGDVHQQEWNIDMGLLERKVRSLI